MHGFDLLHTQLGLPWWAAIAVASVGLRALVLPLNFQAVCDRFPLQPLRGHPAVRRAHLLLLLFFLLPALLPCLQYQRCACLAGNGLVLGPQRRC
jgi:hypothetical protein